MPSTLISQPEKAYKCVHCGLDFHYQNGVCPSTEYCCWGCKTVYELLTQSGFQKFYDIKADGVCFAPPLPALSGLGHFDHWDTADREVQIYVGGVHCSACLWLLEQIPQALPDAVASARLDIGKSLFNIVLREEGKTSQVASLIRSWGYRPQLVTESKEVKALQNIENQKQILELGIAGALAGNIMLMSLGVYAGAVGGVALLFDWVAGALAIPVVFYSGRSLFVNVRRSFQLRYFSIDTPILLAILVAFFWSWSNLIRGQSEVYFDSLSSLVFLILASRYVLNVLRRYDLSLTSSYEKEGASIPVALGDLVHLQVDQALSFDAIIRSGACYVNQAFLSGESAPVFMNSGEIIYAGSTIMGFGEGAEGSSAEVIAINGETRLAKIIEQLKKNTGQNSRVEKLYDRLAEYLMLTVLFVGAGVLTWHGYQGEWQVGISRTMALFIVTCPCALAFATPLNISFALREALKNGLVIKNPDAFELGQKIKNIFFDKTGTLTESNIKLKALQVPREKMKYLRALVSRSQHPMSRAIMSEIGLGELATCTDWREHIGRGLEANISDLNYKLLKSNSDLDVTLPSVDFFEGEALIGRIIFNNAPRAEAKTVVSRLRASGYTVHILSGDRNAVVKSVARELGIYEQNSKGECLPEDKALAVSSEDSLFVGDGINDALAIKKATVGMAMHGGLQTALENSSIYMIRPDLNLVEDYLLLAKKVRRIHSVNFVYSTVYNIISGSLAIFGLMNPLVAAVVMPLSATSVFIYTFYSYRSVREERGLR